MSINDGGQAFPCAGVLYPDGAVWDAGSNGMTRRDYFAAKAMQPILLAAMQVAGPESSVDFASIAASAYRMSDSMLKAREAA